MRENEKERQKERRENGEMKWKLTSKDMRLIYGSSE
jgi:hypothetical protein